MVRIAFPLALLFALAGAYPDTWTSADKIPHVFVSALGTTGGYLGLRYCGVAAGPALGWSMAGMGALCVGKEIVDRFTPGSSCSVRDIVWDAVGIALTAVIIKIWQRRYK